MRARHGAGRNRDWNRDANAGIAAGSLEDVPWRRLGMTLAARYHEAIDAAPMRVRCGRMLACNGLTMEARGPEVSVGERCEIRDQSGSTIEANVVGFRDGRVILMPFGEVQQITVGARVRALDSHHDVPVGRALLGRVVDAFGNPIDERGPIGYEARVPL